MFHAGFRCIFLMPLSWKMYYASGKLNRRESFVTLCFILERTAITHSSRRVCGTWFFLVHFAWQSRAPKIYPKCRLPRKIDWSLNYDLIRKSVLDCQTKWAKKDHVPQTALDEWVNAVLSKVKSKATKLSQGFSFPETQSIFHDKGVKKNVSKTCMKDS